MSWYEDRVFPHLLNWATRPVEKQRRELLARADGRVLELGVGTGANFAHYPDAATDVHGIEPTQALLEMARAHAATLPQAERFDLRLAGAEALPYPDQHFDCAIACLVFCTIPDNHAAAAELARVLKPGGKLLVLEHVASERPRTRKLQNWLNPAWQHLACGCQLNRDTGDLLAASGFDMSDVARWKHPKIPGFAGELLIGEALRH